MSASDTESRIIQLRRRSPFRLLLPYQRRWILDPAQFKIGVWSRQILTLFLD